MKKRILVLFVAAILIATFPLMLMGCNKNNPPMDNVITVPDLTEGATIVDSSSSKTSAKLIDNTRKVWKSEKYTARGFTEYVEFDFGNPVVFNTAVIEENGSNVRIFRLQKFVSDKWVDFYRSDKIEDYRMCSFTPVETQKLRFVIDDATERFEIKELAIYNIPKKEMTDEFRMSAYVRFDGDNPRAVLEKGEEYAKTYAKYFEVITDVILFNIVSWDVNGDIYYTKDGNSPKNAEEAAAFENNFAADLAAFKTILTLREKQTPVRITATFLNPGNDTAKSLSNNMEKVVNNIYDNVVKYDLDGIDIDWEYPKNNAEWDMYGNFINQINDKFDTYTIKDLMYTCALSAWGNHFDAATIARIDQVNYMGYDAYDEDGWQSTFKVTAVDATAHFRKLGFKPSQINLGIPSFARTTDGAPEWPVWRSYDFGEEGYWKNYYNNIPYNGDLSSMHFNSPAMAYDKTAYSINVGLGGVMLFRLACDKLMDDPNCITKAIGKAIEERSVFTK